MSSGEQLRRPHSQADCYPKWEKDEMPVVFAPAAQLSWAAEKTILASEA